MHDDDLDDAAASGGWQLLTSRTRFAMEQGRGPQTSLPLAPRVGARVGTESDWRRAGAGGSTENRRGATPVAPAAPHCDQVACGCSGRPVRKVHREGRPWRSAYTPRAFLRTPLRCAAAATPGVEWKTPLSCRSRVRPPRRRRRARHAALAALPRRPLRRRRRAWGRCSLKRSPDTVPGSLTTRMHRLANRERAWPRRSGARPPRRRRRARHAVLAAPAVRCVRHAVPVPRGAFRHAVQRSSR